jgi:hypothetical protein
VVALTTQEHGAVRFDLREGRLTTMVGAHEVP